MKSNSSLTKLRIYSLLILSLLWMGSDLWAISSPKPAALWNFFYYLRTVRIISFSANPTYFSPNINSTNIRAQMQTKPSGLQSLVRWTIQIKNSGGTVVRTYSGKGISVNIIWNGRNSQNVVVSDGIYNIKLSTTLLLIPMEQRTIQMTVDKTAPVLNITSPSEGQFTNSQTLNVSGSTNEDLNQLTLNGSSVVVSNRTFNTTCTLTEGVNTLSLIAVDRAGNTAQVNRQVTLDTTVPNLTIDTPRDGDTVIGH